MLVAGMGGVLDELEHLADESHVSISLCDAGLARLWSR